ncbi:hypothetical protein HQ585_20765 [candidate division KSB1 bacterium]|nr:hypothetical protein [candidate division KSB1 bacterium]
MKSPYTIWIILTITFLSTTLVQSQTEIDSFSGLSRPELSFRMALLTPNEPVDSEMILAFGVAPSDTSQTDKLEVDTPVQDRKWIILQPIPGLGLGMLCGFLGWILGAQFDSGSEDEIGLGQALLGSVPGYTIGSVTGVYLIGKHKTGKGSYLATLAGGIIGTIAVSAFTTKNDIGPFWPLVFFVPPVMSTIAFQLSL